MNTSFKKFIVTLGIVCLGFVQSFAINKIDGNWADYGLTSAYDGYYVIANVQDLESFKTMTNNYSGTYSSSNAVLTADIIVNPSVLDANGELRSDYETAVTRKWTGGMSSFSINYNYSGVFDGNNHTISGLYIKKTANAYLGLFEYLDGATIKNLKIEDSYIQGKACVGGICGSRASSAVFTISNCSVNAYILSNSEMAGGIYGGYASASIIENCVNKGTIVSNGDYVGGICSQWSGTITNCTNQGTVRGMLKVGGIVGNQTTAAITLCSNTGTVSGSQSVGGIAGNSSSQINKCCNFGKVEGFTYIGGIAGSISAAMSDVFNVGSVSGDNGYVGGLAGSAGNISYAYNAGLVSNNSYLTNIGGLCGKCTGTMTNCYYDSNVCPFKAVNNATYSGATAKTTTQMCSTTLLTGFSSSIWTAGTTSVSGSLTKIDDEFATKNNGRYPRLTGITKYPYANIRYYNTGTASSPTWVEYTPIYSTVDFASMNNSSKVFVLMNDIVEASNISDGTLLETPAVAWTPVTLFKGKLYGRGKTISGLCMTSGTNGGLFAEISDASIIDVNIANCVFKGTSSVGSITATASGESYITNCNNYCDFNLSTSCLGGICGSVTTESSLLTITRCNNYGNILGNTTNCGGIIGEVTNKSVLNVTACINNGDISGNIVGGILGYGYGMSSSEKGTITQCINNGTISSSTCTKGTGGIVGYQVYFSQVTNCLNTGKIINTNAGGTGGIMGEESSGNYIKYCLNLGSISSRSTSGAICGKPGTLWAYYNYYNSDSCAYKAIADEDERNKGEGKTTEQLISGTLPNEFSSDYWAIRPAEIKNMKKYYYFPYLKCFGEESAILAQVKDCHTVSINLNGGTTTDNIITFYVETEQALLPTNVQKDGCTFDGWYDNSNYTSNPFTEVPLTETQPKSFYAKWLANNYTITYSLDGGTINNGNVQLYTYGYGTMLPADVSRTGYTFDGWYSNPSFSGYPVTSISSTEYGNKSFYAKWTAIRYYITYNANDGEIAGAPQTTYYYGNTVTLPTPTRQGYTFKGWFNNSNLTGSEITEITSSDYGDKVFYAKWSANEYTVSLNPDGGKINVGDVTNYTYGTYTMLPNNVTRTGYTFQGWFTIQSCDAVLVSCQKTIPFIKAVQSVFGYSLIQARDSVYSWYDNLPVHLSMTVTKALEFQKQAETCDAIVSLENMVLSGGNTVCDLILESYGSSKLSVIKIVKNYTGLGLTQAKTLVESAPVAVLTQVPEETALAMKGELDAISGVVTSFANNAGGTATTAIYPTDLGDKYLGAKWEANTYSVNLQVNGGTNTNNVSEYTYGVGATLPDSSEISRTGYTFVGWYMNSNYDGVAIEEIATTDFGDKTFYAKWNVNSYDVTLNANGGTINSGNIASYTYGVGATLPTDITKTGYTFGGWYDNSSCSGSSVLSIASNATDDKEFWAKWDTINYTITYNANEGEFAVTPVSNYKYGDEIVLATPTREGYDFGGWYNNSNLVGTEFTKVEATETGNKEFWAKWDVQSYDVTLNVNEGTINSGNLTIYTYGTLAILPQDVTKVGHKFDGWFDNAECSGTAVTQISKGSTGDKTFYAGWTPRTYTVTLQTNNGTINNGTISSYTYGKGATLPTDITKTGYEFQGWYDNSSYDGGKVTAIASNEVGDRNFWAKWTANTYTVNFETNDGTINSGNINGYTYGVTAILPTDVTKDGYTFTGWYSDEECKGDVVSIISSTETGNKTFYAGWSKSAYSVTLHTNDGIISSGNVTAYTFGSEVKLPTEEQIGKTGYTFGGWYDNASCIGSSITSIPSTEIGNKQFWAKWSVNTYNITFVMNEGTINSGNVKNYVYGTTVVLPSDVVKTGYMFDGWYIDEDCSGESVLSILSTDLGDKTFYANWIVNSYNVILVTNEGTINSENIENYTYGTGATLPTDVTKEGYTFAGWYTNSSYIGGSVASVLPLETGDKTFYAKWTVNEYKVSADYDKVMGTVTGEDYYEYKSTATLKAIANEGYEFVGWNDNELKDERIQLTVTKDTTLVANFKEKEKVQIAGSLEIPTLKTEREAQPIDLNGLFTTTEGGEVTYTASSSAPNVVAATVSEGKLFLTVYEYEGEAEITVTATLPNGEKNSVKATAEVILACNIQVEETITNVSCYGKSDGEIALKVTNAAEPYTTLWTGATATTDTIKDVTAGNYSVEITDNENCSFTKTYTVSQPEEMKLSAKIKHPTCENADGSITITLTGAENASFSWSDESTNQNIANLKKGDYSVVITNTETGCQISDSYTLVEPEAPVISVATTVETACDKADGAVYITANSDDLIYKWSNSKTTKDLVGVRAGDYTLDVVDSKNCKASLSVTVPSIKLKQPEIALVTVSQESGKNLVVWLKENTDLIDYYTIYRVDTAKNKYDKVADVPYGELSVYEDLAANPMERAWKYKMSATDVCGNETAMSDYHSSLHLMKIKSLGVENHLAWDPYEGIDFDSYVILRKTKVKGVAEIDTLAMIPSDLTSYTDTLPARGTTSYYVGVKLPETINPKTQFLKAESGPFSLAMSNIAEVENNVAVQNVVKSNADVYAIGHTIYVKNAEYAETAVYDVKGGKINFAKDATEYEFNIKLDGVYLVKVGESTFKVIIK